MKAYMFNEEDTVVTTESLDAAKQWYAKEIGANDSDIEEIDPETETMFYEVGHIRYSPVPPAEARLHRFSLIDGEMFYEVGNIQHSLVPSAEAGLHQFSLIDGDVYERVTIKEAWEREGSPDGTHIIAHQG